MSSRWHRCKLDTLQSNFCESIFQGFDDIVETGDIETNLRRLESLQAMQDLAMMADDLEFMFE